MQHKPDDYQQEQLGFENRKHKTNGYLIHILLGLTKRLFYFRTVYMYTSVRVYVLYYTYVIIYNMFDTILYVITILPGLDNTIMIIQGIQVNAFLCFLLENKSKYNQK